jgi:hypothetical protein
MKCPRDKGISLLSEMPGNEARGQLGDRTRAVPQERTARPRGPWGVDTSHASDGSVRMGLPSASGLLARGRRHVRTARAWAQAERPRPGPPGMQPAPDPI